MSETTPLIYDITWSPQDCAVRDCHYYVILIETGTGKGLRTLPPVTTESFIYELFTIYYLFLN